MKYLRAQILRAQRGESATIICPNCGTTQVITMQNMDKAFKEQCSDCNCFFKVDLNDLMKKINWVGKISLKNNKQ